MEGTDGRQRWKAVIDENGGRQLRKALMEGNSSYLIIWHIRSISTIIEFADLKYDQGGSM